MTSNKDFSGQNLNGQNFSEQDLRDCNFSEASLDGANFSHAILNDANLQNAQMRGVNFKEAILYGADLSESKLYGATFTGAIVKDSKFINCQGLDQKTVDDLKRRGAIVDYHQPKQEKDIKWWVKYVLVPLLIALISSGSIVSLVNWTLDKIKGIKHLPSDYPTSLMYTERAFCSNLNMCG